MKVKRNQKVSKYFLFLTLAIQIREHDHRRAPQAYFG